jgi:hypothetical protein
MTLTDISSRRRPLLTMSQPHRLGDVTFSQSDGIQRDRREEVPIAIPTVLVWLLSSHPRLKVSPAFVADVDAMRSELVDREVTQLILSPIFTEGTTDARKRPRGITAAAP